MTVRPFDPRRTAARLLRRVIDVRDGELVPAVLSGLYFFCLLFGYFMLRPLRDAMGLDGGVDSLRVLFLVTLGVMVAANVLFGVLASRLPRRVLVPLVYWIAIACLAGFLALLLAAGERPSPWVGRTFYVWLSVFNLFAVSVFWAFMADLFTLDQGKRLFGFIGVGGTAGAICGSAWTGLLAQRLGDAGLMASGMLLVAGAAVIATLLGRLAARRPHPEGDRAADPPALGGSAWHGVTAVVRSPFLLGIAAYVALYTILSTLLYFEKMRIVAGFVEEREARASILAFIEMAGQTATILVQLFLTGRLMRRLGVAALLAVVPVITILGFIGLAAVPGLLVIGVLEACRRAGNHALSKPARETLFTLVPREARYKAKAFIDTFIYRGGDTVGTLGDLLMAALGAGVWLLALPLGGVSLLLSVVLGRRERRPGASAASDGSGGSGSIAGPSAPLPTTAPPTTAPATL